MLLALLQAARGENRFRGRQENQYSKQIIWLEVQARGTSPASRMLAIHVEDGRAYYRAARGFVYSSQFVTLAEFLAQALELCRAGGPFVQSYDDKALYK
jgi:hypothetical protein